VNEKLNTETVCIAAALGIVFNDDVIICLQLNVTNIQQSQSTVLFC